MPGQRKWLLSLSFILLGIGIGILIAPQNREILAEPATSRIPKELYSYRDVVKKVVPAVVSIESRGKTTKKIGSDIKFKDNDVLGFGSGVITNPNGVIVTSFHVVEGAENVNVFLPDGRKFTTRDIRLDRQTDLAVLRIVPDKPFPFLEFGDSDAMEVGDRVLAVGAPFGLTSSVTHGIISAKSRNLRLNQYEDFLQTDAAINPGNSGGPLVNLEGQIIGINSAIKSKSGGFQGVGLAISSKLTKNIMLSLLKDGVVRRGYLGIQIKEIDATLAEKLGVKEGIGVFVTGLFPESPAAKGGIKASDIVLKIGNLPVRDSNELSNRVAALTIGQTVDVMVLRAGQQIPLKVTIAEQPLDFGKNGE